MLINENRIIVAVVSAIVLSGTVVFLSFKKALEHTELGETITVARDLAKIKKVDLTVPPRPRPVLLSTLPGTNISNASLYRVEVKTKDSSEAKKSKPDKDPLLKDIEIVAVSKDEISIIDGANSFSLKVGEGLKTQPKIKLWKIDERERRATFSADGRSITISY
jgi:hypothetical protein